MHMYSICIIHCNLIAFEKGCPGWGDIPACELPQRRVAVTHAGGQRLETLHRPLPCARVGVFVFCLFVFIWLGGGYLATLLNMVGRPTYACVFIRGYAR